MDGNNVIADWHVGLDLGQVVDFTAIAAVETVRGYRGFDSLGRPIDVWLPAEQLTYNVRHLERLPTGTLYPAQVTRVATLIASLPVMGRGTVGEGSAQRVLETISK